MCVCDVFVLSCVWYVYMHGVALFPGLPRFYLPFVFITIHGIGKSVENENQSSLPCIIVNANGRYVGMVKAALNSSFSFGF